MQIHAFIRKQNADHKKLLSRNSFMCNTFCSENITGTIISIHNKNQIMMKNMLFITAGIFFTAWIIGFFFIGAGTLIHTLALFALIFCLQGVITTPKSIQESKTKS